jgi:DNA polymerase I
VKVCVFDIEANSLTPDVVWCIVAKDLSDGQVTVFDSEHKFEEFQAYIQQFDRVVGHNVIEYDLPALEFVGGVRVDRRLVLDTLVLSRLLNQGREGGHSLEAWGSKLDFPKGDHTDFSSYSDRMREYCINDVELNAKIYERLWAQVERNKGSFDEAIRVEMQMAFICREMHDNGFKFNYEEAKKIAEELDHKVAELDLRIEEAFQPKVKAIREVTPRETKHGTISRTDFRWYEGTDYSIFSVGAPFTLFEYVPFNPGSPKQVVDRLWEAGWKPTDKTKTHIQAEKDRKVTDDHKRYGWKINEANISSLPDRPDDLKTQACNILVERILLAARRRTLEEWFSAYDPKDQRVHGRFNALGTRTHRCSHNAPNMGNIATKKTIKYNSGRLRGLAIDYGGRMRSLWHCDDDAWLVGCDMEGAHLRIFAHLIRDDGFVKALCEGKKEDGSDVHSLNKRNLGELCVDRDRAKTFIFSFLNGAGAGKVAEIFGCTSREAKDCLDGYVRAYPGLVELKAKTIPRDAARGYFVGFDGRKVVNDSEHHMIGMYLQNAESVVMKHANVLWKEQLNERGITFRQVNWVHDEWVTEVYGTREDAELVGRIQAESIATTGVRLKCYCPLSGEFKVGRNWLDVH